MIRKQRNNTIFWLIFTPIAIALLSYLFVILHFFSLSPNNITAKMAVWPFFSVNAKAQLYQQATVEVRFTVDPADLKLEDRDSYGDSFKINGTAVTEDGFVLIPFHDYLEKNKEIFVYAYSGTVYRGKLVFCDETLFLAVVKCENMEAENTSPIKIPFVQISDRVAGTVDSVVNTAFQVNGKWQAPATGQVYQSRFDYALKYQTVDGTTYLAADQIVETFYETKSLYRQGAVYNQYGYLIGLEVTGFEFDDFSTSAVIPAFRVKSFLNQIASSYYANRPFVTLGHSLKGISREELSCHLKISDTVINNNLGGMDDGFVFEDKKIRYDENKNILNFNLSEDEGFLLLEDLVGKGPDGEEVKIDKFSVIGQVKIGGATHKINSHDGLLEILFATSEGTEVTFFYKTDVFQQDYLTATFVA